VNINTATAVELDALPGIGPTAAQAIIDYRLQHGSFQFIQDIQKVPGIGPASFDKIKDYITVGP
jgi:competence protein ComEA